MQLYADFSLGPTTFFSQHPKCVDLGYLIGVNMAVWGSPPTAGRRAEPSALGNLHYFSIKMNHFPL